MGGTHHSALTIIGWCRTPYGEKVEAPRQGVIEGARGTLEIDPQFADGLDGIEVWTHLWVIFGFDRAGETAALKVLPPRAAEKKGVFSTRSPHRPSSIGMTAVQLERAEGTTLHVRGVDMLDGSPIFDIKPYVPYADSIEGAGDGWLGREPEPTWKVVWSEGATAQREMLASHGIDIREAVERALALGPTPHAYRRIRREGDAWVLAWKDLRFAFAEANDRRLEITEIRSGYRERELAEGTGEVFVAHRALR